MCCQPLHQGKIEAASAEQLMRSRYSAFCLKNIDYLIHSTDPQTRLKIDIEATREWAEKAHFIKLEILRSNQEGNKGMVEFKAYYEMPGEAQLVHHEFSKFRKQSGRWYFREGRQLESKSNAKG